MEVIPPPRSSGLAPVEEWQGVDGERFQVQQRIAAATGTMGPCKIEL